MDFELVKKELLKHARNAFETACTLRNSQRIEVYLENGEAKSSDILEEDEDILYTPQKILCYAINGYDYLEDEIKTWIDYARVLPQLSDEMPFKEPTNVEKSIRELIAEIAKRNNMRQEEVSSYEVFANLPMDLLGTIEQQIIEYWWGAEEEENGKKLALLQIEEAIATL